MARYSTRTSILELYSGSGETWQVSPTQMDVSIPNIAADDSETLEARDRHQHDGLYPGDELTYEWAITVGMRNQLLTDAAADRMLDWIRGTGKCATMTSIDPNVWAFGARLIMSMGGVTTTIDLPKNKALGTVAVAKEGNTIATAATCYLPIVIT